MQCYTRPYNPCPTTPNAKCIIYTGSNLTNINVTINDRLDVILQNINNAFNDLEFTLYTEDTITLDLEGNGTIQHPLYGNVNVSAAPRNSIIINGDGLFSPSTIQAGVVYGGIVTWIDNYNYHVSAAGYYINGNFYESPAADFTLASPDIVDNRLDTFIVDITGNATVLEGIPSSNPAQAPIDPAIQLELSIALVEVGTTQPTINKECIYLENTEWTTLSSNVAKIDPNSLASPCEGVKSIRFTTAVTSNNILFTRSSNFTPGSTFTQLNFQVRPITIWGGQTRVSLRWELAGTPVGSPVTFGHGLFGFSGINLTTCQIVAIPMTIFGLAPGQQVDSFRITVTSGTINATLDELCVQNMPIVTIPTSPDEKVKVSVNDTTAGYLLGKLVAGTGITLTELNNGGNETYSISASSSLTFDNGLTKTVNNVQLGGELIHDTTIDTTANYSLIVDGDIPTTTGDGTLIIRNFALSGNAVYSEVVSGTAVYGSATTGIAIQGIATSSGTAVNGNSSSGTAIYGTTISGVAADLLVNPSSTATVVPVLRVERLTSGTALTNIGASIQFMVATDLGGATEATNLIARWTNVAHASRTSQTEITQLNSGTMETHLILKGTGQLQLPKYGSGTFTGTATRLAAFDANGNLIEEAISGIGVPISSLLPAIADNTINNLDFEQSWQWNTLTGNALSLSSSSTATDGYRLLNINGTGSNSTGTATYGVYSSISRTSATAQSIGVYGEASNGVSNIGILGISLTGTGIEGQGVTGVVGVASTGGTGGNFTDTDGGIAVNASSTNGTVFQGLYLGDVSSIINTLRLSRITSSGTALNDIGQAILFNLETTSGSNTLSNRLISQWADATHASRTSRFTITGVNSGTTGNKFVLNGDGSAALPDYGGGTISGTATFGAAFDINGNIIEVALGGAGFTNPMAAIGDIITSSDGAGTPVAISPGVAGTVLTSNGAGAQPTYQALAGSGTVTTLSVVTANGFAGSVANPTTTPAITLTTSITGLLKGNGTAISAAVAGTDYVTGNIYTTNGTLSGDRVITLSGNSFKAVQGATDFLSIEPTANNEEVVLQALNTTGLDNQASFSGLTTASDATTTIASSFNGGANVGSIILFSDASSSFNVHNADIHEFLGGVTLAVLAGNGTGIVTVSNTGVLGFGNPAGTGTVTSVAVSGGTTGLSTSGGPITGSGTITFSGTLIAASGGTGQVSYTIGDILQASSSSVLSKLAAVATGNVLISGGVGTVNSWGKVNLTTHVTGDLPYANLAQGLGLSVLGVTGSSTADNASITAGSDHSILRRSGSGIAFGTINLAQSGAVGSSVLGVLNGGTGQSTYTNGQLLIGNSTGSTLTKATLTAGQGIQIVNSTGSITVASSFNPARVSLTDASTITWNINNGEAAVVTLGNINRTLAITNPVAGRTYVIEIVQGVGGNKTISIWPTGTTWVGGIPPTLSTVEGQVDVVSFYWNGTNYRAVFNGPFA